MRGCPSEMAVGTGGAVVRGFGMNGFVRARSGVAAGTSRLVPGWRRPTRVRPGRRPSSSAAWSSWRRSGSCAGVCGKGRIRWDAAGAPGSGLSLRLGVLSFVSAPGRRGHRQDRQQGPVSHRGRRARDASGARTLEPPQTSRRQPVWLFQGPTLEMRLQCQLRLIASGFPYVKPEAC